MKLRALLPTLLVVMLIAGNSMAIPLNSSSNITINDTFGTPPTPSGEDNEVEPGCIANQFWDLEGFFLEGNTLTMVGGYDFKNGYAGKLSGDIFIDSNNDAVWGQDIGGSGTITNDMFHFDYAIDLDFTNKKYNVYTLTNDTLVRVTESINQESNPLELVLPPIPLPSFTGDLKFYENLTDAEVAGLSSTWNDGGLGTHYAVELLGIDGFLSGDFLAKFTYDCGNDNLIGKASIPDATTLSLLGSAMVIAALFGRRKRFGQE